MEDTDPKYQWTVMVYLAGDNNLTEECVYSLQEMKRIDTGNRIKVTAQYDPRGRKTPVHRYSINKAKDPAGVSGVQGGGKPLLGKISDDVTPVVEGTKKYPYQSASRGQQEEGAGASAGADAGVDPEANTGDPKTLFDFISWSVEQYKAVNYMVVLAGHGGGTEEDFLLKDENPRGSLSIPDLQRVFQAVKEVLDVEINILGMDVCLMSMGEVCYELKGLAQYVVSAEGYSATAGWPYGKILAELDAGLQSGQNVSPEAVGRMIVNEYTNYYSDYMVAGFSSDLSVMDVRVPAMTALADKVKILTILLNEELSKAAALKEATGRSEFIDQIVLAHWEAQSYNGERFADLYDFCSLLGERYPAGELSEDASDEEREAHKSRERLQDAIERVKEEISDRVVRLSCYSGVDYQYSYGLSVYFPWAEVGPHYKNLDFATASGWNDFLEAYTKATRRNPRGYFLSKNRLWSKVEAFREGKYRTGGYRTGGYRDPGVNPIYSMRNPPLNLIDAGQSKCLAEKVEMIENLDISFFE